MKVKRRDEVIGGGVEEHTVYRFFSFQLSQVSQRAFLAWCGYPSL